MHHSLSECTSFRLTMDVSNPRRILAVSLDDSSQHLAKFVKGNFTTCPRLVGPTSPNCPHAGIPGLILQAGELSRLLRCSGATAQRRNQPYSSSSLVRSHGSIVHELRATCRSYRGGA